MDLERRLIPCRYVFGVIAFLGYWIVNGTNGTSVASWLFVVDANVEELTAVGIRVKRVGYHGPAVTFYLRSLGTLEANDVCKISRKEKKVKSKSLNEDQVDISFNYLDELNLTGSNYNYFDSSLIHLGIHH